MKEFPADQPSSPNNSPESEVKPNSEFTESNRTRLQTEPDNNWPHHQWAREDRETQIALRNGYSNVPQRLNKPTSLSFWERIPQGVKAGAFFLAAAGIVVAVAKYPLPSTQEQQASIAKPPLQSQPIPPLEVPNSPLPPPPQALPSPLATPLPQLSPLPEIPLPDPLTSSLPKIQDQPLSVNPSPIQLPSPSATGLNPDPSLTGSVPVKPPSVSSLPPLKPPSSPCTEAPCSESTADGETPAASTTENTTKINKNTPLAEVKNYFQKGWQPPSGLKESLAYSVAIGADGTIQQIMPLSNAAGEYIDSTKIPLPGSPFVSPIQGGGKTNISLTFNPNGTVQASLE